MGSLSLAMLVGGCGRNVEFEGVVEVGSGRKRVNGRKGRWERVLRS